MRTPPDPVGDLLDSARLVTKSWQGRTAKARFQALLALESAGPPARAGRDEYNPLRLIRARGPAIYSPASRFLIFSDDYAARLSFSGLFDNMKIHWRSEEHKSELQSIMRISYAVFCLKKKMKKN